MAYALDNALFEWNEGERGLSAAPAAQRTRLDRALRLVQGELRRRLGGAFTMAELADLYGDGVDWAWTLAEAEGAGTYSSNVVDAAFGRYVRGATDWAGGRPSQPYRPR